MKIVVSPSNNLFSELGNNTYDYKDLLSELIDNSVAARIPGKLLSVRVEVYVDKDQRPQKFVIWDDASGIPEEKLGNAITPAGIQTTGSLNEHGLGMKQAVAAIGKLEFLTTKTADRALAIRVTEFKFGEIDADEIAFDREHGTTLTMTNVRPIVSTNATSISRSIIPYLGSRYRRFLRPESPLMHLRIELKTAEKGQVTNSWDVQEVKPIYFHPGSRENRPVIGTYPLEGKGWKAQLTFGYAPQENLEYEELGLVPPNKFHPYRVALATQGFDIILHDRVILFHQLSEIEIINQRHSDYNSIRGEIILLSGFTTAITKNSVMHDAHYRECIERIKEILHGDKAGPEGKKVNYLQHKSYPTEIPEKLLRDRLMYWLKNNPLNKKAEVSKEYVIEGVEGFIDILADKEAWELKREQANALDVYQLFMYLDVGDWPKGFLLAKGFSPGALIAAKRISEKHGKDIVLAARDQFPINHPPTTQEREDYY
jgi:hypothetical protein